MEADCKISLVIPVRDEELSIGRLLASISAQTRLPDEVIFVDAGSIDRTVDIIKAYNDARFKLKLISIGSAYPGTARNAGAREAAHQLIAFTDGGIELDRNWMKELKPMMERDVSIDVVYGNYIPRTDTFFKQCLSMAIVPPPAGNENDKTRPRFIASSLLKKRVWEEVGGFPDLRAAEDRVFMELIEKRGYVSKSNPRAFVVWDVPGDLCGVFRRFSNYSYHDLIASRTKDWHVPVLRMYLSALFCIGLGLFVSPLFFNLPPIGIVLRAGKKIFINIKEPYFNAIYVPLYFVSTGFLIIYIDIAMFAGWARYLLEPAKDRKRTHDL